MATRVSKAVYVGPLTPRPDPTIVAHHLGDLLIDLVTMYPTIEVSSLRITEREPNHFVITGNLPERPYEYVLDESERRGD